MVRTRFAPSPTGELHIGGARTALFNFLFARHFGSGGVFILRIDDTDVSRSTMDFEAKLMEDLRWLGLNWDEGPDMGLAVPYRQSERLALYNSHLLELKTRGFAYPCFCSEEHLEAVRQGQISKGTPPIYDGACRALTSERASAKIADKEPHCWRFAMPDAPVKFNDKIRGELAFNTDIIGDFVLARSDGAPTYLFTTVVDDHLMDITHIIRGDEHVPNTVRQQVIFDALGWTPPVYAHIPMILSENRQKLSKRTGSTPIREYRERGYRPEAIDAYLSTLSWTPPSDTALLSLESAAADFSLDGRISTSPPVHDDTHLKYWQKEAVKALGSENILKELVTLNADLAGFEKAPLLDLIDDLVDEHYTVSLLLDALGVLFETPPKREEPWLNDLAHELSGVDTWDGAALDVVLRSFMKGRGLKGKDFFHPLRLAITARDKGAALTLVMPVLGKKEVLSRLSFTGGVR